MGLPEPNESVILWSDDADCLVRLRMSCIATPWPKKSDTIVHRYTLHTEMCEVCENDDGEMVEDWIASSVPPSALSSVMRILLDLGRAANPTLVSILRVVVKGKTEFPTKKPAKIARAQGWSVTLSPEGSLTNGDPLFRIQFSRPLIAEEMVAFIGQLAKAIDHYERSDEDR
jgi:hypothetical protein